MGYKNECKKLFSGGRRQGVSLGAAKRLRRAVSVKRQTLFQRGFFEGKQRFAVGLFQAFLTRFFRFLAILGRFGGVFYKKARRMQRCMRGKRYETAKEMGGT